MFVGREQELASLEEFYAKDGIGMTVIYGRRRIGKSTLITEFVKDKKTVFYTATKIGKTRNLELFSKQVLDLFMPGIENISFNSIEAVFDFIDKNISRTNCGLGPITLIVPPDVKIETTFFQRNFFSTIPCNYPQKQHKKRTSDLSEVPILRCFLKILPLSASLPASYQIPPDCTPNGIFPSNDTSFPHPIRTFSISFAALAHY